MARLARALLVGGHIDATVNNQPAAGISGGYLLIALGLRFGTL